MELSAFFSKSSYLELAQVIGRHICKLGLAQAFLIPCPARGLSRSFLAGMTMQIRSFMASVKIALEAIQALFKMHASVSSSSCSPTLKGYHPSFKIKRAAKQIAKIVPMQQNPVHRVIFSPSATGNHQHSCHWTPVILHGKHILDHPVVYCPVIRRPVSLDIAVVMMRFLCSCFLPSWKILLQI